jgi:hypothetical protein
MPLDKFSIRGSPSTAQREVRDASSSPLGQSLHQARNLVPGRSARLNGRASQEITCLVSVATASGIADATQLGDPCSQPRPTGSEARDVIGSGAYRVGHRWEAPAVCSNDLRLSLHGRIRTTQCDAQRLAPQVPISCMHCSQAWSAGAPSFWHSSNTTEVANPSIIVQVPNNHWTVRIAVTPAVCSPKSMVNGRVCKSNKSCCSRSNRVHRLEMRGLGLGRTHPGS